MHISSRVTTALAVAAVVTFAEPTARLADAPFSLSVDSIMRGPKLVGYPPTGLRWSGDSARLYFEWRRPGEDEPSTWVVARDGGEPRRLTDGERRSAPPVAGMWDAAHRRALFANEGDIVLVDSVTGTRRQITRMTGGESNPRWAKHETAVTFVRDNNLFLVPLDSGSIEQLTDIAPRKRDARESDSQKFVKNEEEKLIDHTRVEAEKKKRRDEKEKANALPKYVRAMPVGCVTPCCRNASSSRSRTATENAIASRSLMTCTRRRFAACRVDRLIVYIRLALPAAGRPGGLC